MNECETIVSEVLVRTIELAIETVFEKTFETVFGILSTSEDNVDRYNHFQNNPPDGFDGNPSHFKKWFTI